MTARTVSTVDSVTGDPMFGAPADPVVETTPDNVGMMAGSDMYRRMQAKPKPASSNSYLIGGVAAVAIIAAGGFYVASHQSHAGAQQAAQTQAAQTAASSAISSDQQAQNSNAQAQAAAAQKSAATADAAQAAKVAETGNPPADTTAAKPTPTRTMTRPHEAVVHHAVTRQAAPSASAAAAGVDASALTPPPPPVTATPPASYTPAPVPASPIPPPTPANPAPDQSTAQPAPTTTPPQ